MNDYIDATCGGFSAAVALRCFCLRRRSWFFDFMGFTPLGCWPTIVGPSWYLFARAAIFSKFHAERRGYLVCHKSAVLLV